MGIGSKRPKTKKAWPKRPIFQIDQKGPILMTRKAHIAKLSKKGQVGLHYRLNN